MIDVPTTAHAASDGSRTGPFIRVADPHPTDNGYFLGRAIARAKQGDTDALHFLYVRYADDVYGVANSIVGDSYAAEDITQNVFGRLMTAIQRYQQRNVPFAAWLLRVTRNAAFDHMRARRQIPVEEVRVDDHGSEQLELERSQSLHEALSRLPEDQREVVVLRHVAGLTPVEIARVLGKTEGSVNGLHHRGRGALKEALRELDAAPLIAAAS
jgi:RNA polymerase sigma-70 factor, ECF subfamily